MVAVSMTIAWPGFVRSLAKIFGGLALVHLWGRWKIARSYAGAPVGKVLIWLWTSRETANFTYDLTADNKLELTRFVAEVTGVEVQQTAAYIRELETDESLKEHVRQVTSRSPKRLISDSRAAYGRRLGWYACVRALKPATVVETGVDKGLGACVLAAALRRNAEEGQGGRYMGTDIDPESGFLFVPPYDSHGEVLIGDSATLLADLEGPVDFVVCDSDHDPGYEMREYEALGPKLSAGAVIISDTAHATDVLEQFAAETGRKYLFFRERPENHWYPGAGIGAAYP